MFLLLNLDSVSEDSVNLGGRLPNELEASADIFGLIAEFYLELSGTIVGDRAS